MKLTFIFSFLFLFLILNFQNLNSQNIQNSIIDKEEGTLPVELVYFQNFPYPDAIFLKWGTATEVGNYGFEPQRAFNNVNFESIGFVPGNGNSNSPKHYTFWDSSLVGNGTYHYRLKQLNLNGSIEYYDTITINYQMSDVEEDFSNLPNKYHLFQNYPNPFNPSTIIQYGVSSKEYVVLKIYDVLSREIETLINEEKTAGKYFVEWNAAKYSAGVYYYELKSGNFRTIKKMLLLK